jgi:hypothetical protein
LKAAAKASTNFMIVAIDNDECIGAWGALGLLFGTLLDSQAHHHHVRPEVFMHMLEETRCLRPGLECLLTALLRLREAKVISHIVMCTAATDAGGWVSFLRATIELWFRGIVIPRQKAVNAKVLARQGGAGGGGGAAGDSGSAGAVAIQELHKKLLFSNEPVYDRVVDGDMMQDWCKTHDIPVASRKWNCMTKDMDFIRSLCGFETTAELAAQGARLKTPAKEAVPVIMIDDRPGGVLNGITIQVPAYKPRGINHMHIAARYIPGWPSVSLAHHGTFGAMGGGGSGGGSGGGGGGGASDANDTHVDEPSGPDHFAAADVVVHNAWCPATRLSDPVAKLYVDTPPCSTRSLPLADTPNDAALIHAAQAVVDIIRMYESK